MFNSKRLLILVICFCGMLNYYVYNAGLISYLMVKNIDSPIQDLEDLLGKPQYQLLLVKSTSEEIWFRNSTNINHRKLWEKSVKDGCILQSHHEFENKIKQDKRKVGFAEAPIFDGLADSYPCQITHSKAQYHVHHAGYVFKQDSEYIELFNHAIGKTFEWRTDILDTKIQGSKDKCMGSLDNQFKTMSYDDVISAFAIFAFGCFLALGYLLMEYTNKVVFHGNLTQDYKDISNSP